MRACAAALSNVPHSDEMADDPFRYLGKHILVKTQTRVQEVPNKRAIQRARVPEPLTNITTRDPAAYDTATPSETSKRETLRTTGSTPLTTPGLSAEDTGKRFSDAVRTASAASNSNLKTEPKSAKGNQIYSFLKRPLSKGRPQAPTATKSLTHLPSTGMISVQHREETGRSSQKDPLGTPDFNKSLPSLPRNFTQPTRAAAPDSEKAGILSRLFKTKTNQPQRTQPSVSVQVKAVAPRAAPSYEEDDTNVDLRTKKKRFNITAIFNKPSTAAPKRATVG